MNPGANADPSSSSQADVPRGVCGYIRAEHPDELQIAAQKKAILQHCLENDFRLESVYVDRRVPGDDAPRPGITGVLDVLALPAVMGVVVPSIGHLAEGGRTEANLRRLIRRAGGWLICVEEEPDDFKADGA